ncbi:MAG TPA: ankyrin repeat domain-containing protein, partial [Burkholderiales bacterium]
LMIEAAARGERPEFIDALLQAGARIDFDAPAPSGGSMRWPFNALRNNENELAGMRIGPFGWALLQGKPQLAVRLLQRDRRLEAADRNLAYFAAAAEAWELLLAVLPYTNNVNAANRAGVTALMLAADAGRADVVRALLAAGADVNARSVDSWPPLTEIGLYTRSMPKLGGGNTALRAAKRRGHADVARLLVEAGGSE